MPKATVQPQKNTSQERTTTPSHRHVPRVIRHKEHIQDADGLNTKIAVTLTRAVGTMPTAYSFAILSFVGLLAILGVLPPLVALLIVWASQTFIQLVMLPILSVGQQVLGKHQELQSEEQYKSTMQTYADVETILTRLDKQDQKTYELEQHILAILQAVDKPPRSKSKTGSAE
jgi:hypothetical protein